MKVKIKKLHEDAVVPKYATTGSSGFDLVSIEDVSFNIGDTKLVRTGLSVDIEPGYELQVRPRSGLSLKTPLRVANSPGTVDADFRGEVCVIIQCVPVSYSHDSSLIKKGDRIAQGVICPIIIAEFEEVRELSETDRGEGGFGHTGT